MKDEVKAMFSEPTCLSGKPPEKKGWFANMGKSAARTIGWILLIALLILWFKSSGSGGISELWDSTFHSSSHPHFRATTAEEVEPPFGTIHKEPLVLTEQWSEPLNLVRPDAQHTYGVTVSVISGKAEYYELRDADAPGLEPMRFDYDGALVVTADQTGYTMRRVQYRAVNIDSRYGVIKLDRKLFWSDAAQSVANQ
jgi:hypothetical protein